MDAFAELRRELLSLEGVAGVSGDAAAVRVYLEREDPALAKDVEMMVERRLPGARVRHIVSGGFEALGR